ncbi:hypothetical protein [Haloarcula montana]|uniref:hypothetical protein n=1 Tax=Haloarcula montana TaxID=3111776 RepID=UPI002D78ED4D|nr:hypothetical protein [Haloarcula sp. GH36]
MGSAYRASSRNASQERTWRWKDESDPEPLPQSWADEGRRESPTPAQVPVYAVQCRAGLLLEWRVKANGKVTGTPLRERPAIRAVYVTEDATQAIVGEWDAMERSSGWVPDEDFASVLAKRPEKLDPVGPTDQQVFQRLLDDLYDLARRG